MPKYYFERNAQESPPIFFWKYPYHLSKYTSSGEDFATLQSLIINSLMKNEHKLFVNKHEGGNVMAFVLVICIVIPLNFLSVFLVVVVVISILFF